MKVIGFNGSARKDGNTAVMINCVLDQLKTKGIDTELFQFSGKAISGCKACYGCFKNKDQRCTVDDDVFNECFEKMIDADGMILGSPTYFADVSPEMKSLIDRGGYVARANGNLLKRKVGAAVVVARRAGSIHAFDTINHLFLHAQMIIPGSSYWNLGFGREKGEVAKDEEAMRVMKTLGENMAWLLKKIRE